VHDDCYDVHRRLGAVPSDPYGARLRQQGPCADDPRLRRDSDVRQLVRQPHRLLAHVETFSHVAHRGQKDSVGLKNFVNHFSFFVYACVRQSTVLLTT